MRKAGRPKGSGTNGRRRYLTDDEMSAFFKGAKAAGPKPDLLFLLAFKYAMRVGEIVNVRMTDINMAAKQITIKAEKGGLTRTYELFDDIMKKLKAWLRVRKESPWLFPSRPDANKPASRISVQFAFYRIAERAGVKGHSVHSLRHTSASHVAKDGNIIQVSRWLRQRRISSAEVYMADVNEKAFEKRMGETLRIK